MLIILGDKDRPYGGLFDESDGFDAPVGTMQDADNIVIGKNKQSISSRKGFTKDVDYPTETGLTLVKAFPVIFHKVTNPSEKTIRIFIGVYSFQSGSQTCYMKRYYQRPYYNGSAWVDSWKHITPYYIEIIKKWDGATRFAIAASNIPSQPGSAVTNFAASSITASGATLQWTAVGGISGGYLILRDTATISVTPNYTVYSVGNSIGTAYVQSVANVTGAVVTGLSAGTKYYYKNIVYNASGSAANHRVSDAPEINFVTTANKPTVQPSALAITITQNVTGNLELSWANPTGYDGVLVTMKTSAHSFPTDNPTDRTFAVGDNDFQAGSPVGGAYAVYSGSGTSVSVSGLNAGQRYYVALFAYKYGASDTGSVAYNITSPVTGSRATLSSGPSNPASITISQSVVGTQNATGSLNGAASGLYLIATNQSDMNAPVDGQAYTASGTCIAKTGTTGATVTGLTAGSTYYWRLYGFNVASGGVASGENYTASYVSGQLTVPSAKPTHAPSGLSVSQPTGISGGIELSWPVASTGANNPDGYLIVYSQGAVPDFVPSDGTAYTNGQNVSGIQLIYNTLSPSSTIFASSVEQYDTLYGFRIYSYRGTGSSRSYSTGSATASGRSQENLLGTEPTGNPSGLTIYSVDHDRIGVNWAYSDAANYLVVLATGSNTMNTNPVDGNLYSAGNSLGNSTIVYAGSASSTLITGLSENAQYRVYVIGYNGAFAAECNYKVASNPSGNPVVARKTLYKEPTNQPTNFAVSKGVGQLTISFSAATGTVTPDSYVVIMRAGNSSISDPTDGVDYSIGSTLDSGSSQVVATGTPATITGLNANNQYYFEIFSRKGTSTESNYKTASPLTGSGVCIDVEPTATPSSLASSARTYDSISLTWTPNDTSARFLVLAGPTGAGIDSTPADGVTYAVGDSIGGFTVKIKTGENASSGLVSGLSSNTQYKVIVIPFRRVTYDGTENYTISGTLCSGNFKTIPQEPASQVTAYTAETTDFGEITHAWTNPGGIDGILVVKRLSSAVVWSPSDGVAYTEDQLVDAGNGEYIDKIEASGSTGYLRTIYSTSLETYFAVYTFNGSGADINYKQASPATGHANGGTP